MLNTLAYRKDAEEYISSLHTAEYPMEIIETKLSDIILLDAPQKYYLSAKACQGILNRAKKRGKELPTMLREALGEVVMLNA